MRHQLPASAALLAILAAPGWAKDRPVTDDEKVKLVAAVAAQGWLRRQVHGVRRRSLRGR
jgi:hypothetical protein